LDLDADAARYVILRDGGEGPAIVRADTLRLDRESDLTDWLRRLSPRPAAVVCTLSLKTGAIRAMQLPPTTGDNLDAMVAIEAEQMLPFPAEDLSLGYHVFGINDQSRLEVMLVAAGQEAVERTLGRVNAAPWVSAVASLPALCAASALLRDEPEAAAQGLLLAVLQDSGAELVTLLNGRVASARYIELGTAEGGGPSVAGRLRLAQEIQRSARAVSLETGSSLERILLCGPLAADEGLRKQIQEQAGLSCTAWAPEALGESAPGPAGAALAVAYGAALQAAGLATAAINLTPQRITERRRLRRERQSRWAVAALAVSIALSAVGVFGTALHVRTQTLAAQQKMFQQLKQEAEVNGWPLKPGADKAIAKSKKAIQAAAARPLDGQQALEMINEDLPATSWLSDLSFNSGSGIVLRGYSTRSADPQTMQLALIRRRQFDQVTLNYRDQEMLNDQQVWSFQLTCRLGGKERRR